MEAIRDGQRHSFMSDQRPLAQTGVADAALDSRECCSGWSVADRVAER
jgi:hypothetical protein